MATDRTGFQNRVTTLCAIVGAGLGIFNFVQAFQQRRLRLKLVPMADVSNWTEFVKGCRGFFDANQGCPMFQLVHTLDELYQVAYTRALFPTDFLRECF